MTEWKRHEVLPTEIVSNRAILHMIELEKEFVLKIEFSRRCGNAPGF